MSRLLLSDSVAGLFFQVFPITVLTGLVYAAVRYAWLKKRRLPLAWRAESLRVLFVCYLTGLFHLVLTPQNMWLCFWYYVINGYSGGEVWSSLFSGEFDLVPSFRLFLTGGLTSGSWVRTMLVGNLLMFVPMGFFLPLVSERVTRRQVLLAAVLIPLGVELLQPVVGRSFDVDDLLLNGAGVLLGWLAAAGLSAAVRRARRRPTPPR